METEIGGEQTQYAIPHKTRRYIHTSATKTNTHTLSADTKANTQTQSPTRSPAASWARPKPPST